MRVVANLSSNAIVGTETEQSPNEVSVRNGQYVLQIPDGVAVNVESSSHILPQDATSIPVVAAGELLVRFPMYDHVIYNYFLEDTDIAALDLAGPQPTAGTVTPAGPSWAGVYGGSSRPRCQIGRGGGGPLGIAPNSVAILPVNSARAAPTFGALVTALEDITPFNVLNPGTDDVMMWWEIGTVTNSEDIVHGYGVTVDENTPCLRRLTKIEQEPNDFFVYVSVDNGATWYQANRLEPLDLVVPGVDLRIAFLNTGTRKIFLLGYALLFQDLP